MAHGNARCQTLRVGRVWQPLFMDFPFRRRVPALHSVCHARTLRLDQPVTTRAVLREFFDSTCAMSSQASGRAARRVDRSQLPTPDLSIEAGHRDRIDSLLPYRSC